MEFVCNHLHFRSEDPDAAAKFYCDNFGATIGSVNPLSTTKSIRLELNGQPLMTISGRAEGENPVAGSTEPRYGLDHCGFTVDDSGHRGRRDEDPWRHLHLRPLDHALRRPRSLHRGPRPRQHRADTEAVTQLEVPHMATGGAQ